MHRTYTTLLAALGLAGITAGGAWAQQDGAPGQDGKLGTAATGGAPGAAAAPGAEGGCQPGKPAEPGSAVPSRC